MNNDYYDYIEAGFKIFGLHGVDNKGVCECGNSECQALYKHPRISNWQHTPNWSDEQLETMEEMGQFETGFGVLCDGYVIIDVDPRNGGMESYKKLCKDLKTDFEKESGFVVQTGGGGLHIYFKIDKTIAIQSHLHDYKGIDFKSSGYVVGAGSMHASGNEYEAKKGFPQDVIQAPKCLIDALKKPERYRTIVDNEMIDVSVNDVAQMLGFIDANCDHDTWIKCGMAIHHALNGSGFELWNDWSEKSDKYPSFDVMQKRWHSFGKASNPVTLATVIHYASENGWQSDYDNVTFCSDIAEDESNTLDTSHIDTNRPPGFVGELTQWINDQCLYPREQLAVASALTVVGNLCGLRYVDNMDGMTTNLFTFCVAGSSTGKEAVQQAYLKIMRAAGISAAVHGAFKSEQEVIRNLIRHQMAAYAVDELGIVLKKIKNAQTRGGASYLEGLIGVIMSAYSKANGYMAVSGDVREEITKILQAELAANRKAVDNNEDPTGRKQRRCEQIERALSSIDNGLENPFLSVIGYTTPVTFNDMMDFEQATNGFLSRGLIFNDLETNPKRKQKFSKREMPDSLKYAITNLYNAGSFDSQEQSRIEFYGEKIPVRTDSEAAEALDEVYQAFWDKAEQHKGQTGLEAIPRRGYELVAKVSTILAAPSGLRTKEHVVWAYALVNRDIERKLMLAYANMKEQQEEHSDAVSAKIMNCITKDHGETLGVLVNRCRPHKKDLVIQAINRLIEMKQIIAETSKHKFNKKEITTYFAC